MRSLQRRVIVGGLVWAVAATLIGALTVFSVFDQIADRRYNAALQDRHTQVVVALGTMQSAAGLEDFLTDPAYMRPYSGRYWQVLGETGEIAVSPSLFDTILLPPSGESTATRIWEGEGPNGPLRGVHQSIALEDGSVWDVTIAASLSDLRVERQEMRRSVAVVFALVAVLGIACAGLLTSVLVTPLRKLRNEVAHRWDAGKELVVNDYPKEVAPLVNDINMLLRRNHEILDRGRRQAADLAHALKTPSAALRNELHRMTETGHDTSRLCDALDRIDRQITRSLGRMRATNAAEAMVVSGNVEAIFLRLERLFRSLPATADKAFQTKGSSGLQVRIDAQDLEEILGNLLENAFNWCRSTVEMSAKKTGDIVLIAVEDDGPGIDRDNREIVLQEGARLDTSVPGTGLGLSIANDLALAYGGSIKLDTSDALGGLRVELVFPSAARSGH